jgi:hypothetical protein
MSNFIRNKLLDVLKGFINEWLIGFDDNDFSIGIFSSEKLNFQNAIINAQRVNTLLRSMNSPFRLKAGIIGKLNVKVSKTECINQLLRPRFGTFFLSLSTWSSQTFISYLVLIVTLFLTQTETFHIQIQIIVTTTASIN